MSHLADKLVFGITVRNEAPQHLGACLHRLRQAYPLTNVFVISDGNDLEGYQSVCRKHNTEYFAGERLKMLCTARNGGIDFSRALTYDADFIFKMDPDTWLHRSFRFFPTWDVFGSVSGTTISREVYRDSVELQSKGLSIRASV